MAAHDAKVSGSPSGDEDPDDTFYPGLLALWDELTREEVADFKTALGTAREERDLQSFLEKHPRLLIQQLTTVAAPGSYRRSASARNMRRTSLSRRGLQTVMYGLPSSLKAHESRCSTRTAINLLL